jgi:hypothetical protein
MVSRHHLIAITSLYHTFILLLVYVLTDLLPSQKITLLQHAVPSPAPNTPVPIQRNLDSQMHPLSRARERKRALNASKMERMFAKPFVAAFEGHEDAVCCLEKIRGRVGVVASSGFDGRQFFFSDILPLAVSDSWFIFPSLFAE